MCVFEFIQKAKEDKIAKKDQELFWKLFLGEESPMITLSQFVRWSSERRKEKVEK